MSCRTTQGLGNQEKSGKSQILQELETSAQSPCQNEFFFNTNQKFLINVHWNFSVVQYFT